MMPELQPHQQRVVAEEAELAFKAQKLDDFIKAEKFAAVPAVDQRLLIEQHAHMAGYLAVLRLRIASFGVPA